MSPGATIAEVAALAAAAVIVTGAAPPKTSLKGTLRGAVADAGGAGAGAGAVDPSYAELTDRSEAERPSGGVDGRKGLHATGHDGRAIYS